MNAKDCQCCRLTINSKACGVPVAEAAKFSQWALALMNGLRQYSVSWSSALAAFGGYDQEERIPAF